MFLFLSVFYIYCFLSCMFILSFCHLHYLGLFFCLSSTLLSKFLSLFILPWAPHNFFFFTSDIILSSSITFQSSINSFNLFQFSCTFMFIVFETMIQGTLTISSDNCLSTFHSVWTIELYFTSASLFFREKLCQLTFTKFYFLIYCSRSVDLSKSA